METKPLLADLLASLYDGNPEAIAVYDRGGFFMSCNTAALAVFGYSGVQLDGSHYREHIAAADLDRAEELFLNAVEGKTGSFQASIRDKTGRAVPVEVHLFPARLGDSIEGVFAQARDIAARRTAEREMALQSERIRALYLAAAGRGDTVEAQIDETLALGCRLFDFDYGYVTRFDEQTITILHAKGEGAGVRAGSVYPKANALSRLVAGERQTILIPDLDEPPWNEDPARDTAPWRSYFATKLVVNGRDFGAMVFAGRHPRDGALSETDRDLLQLMAVFLAAALERAAHAERIQQLAFYDSLTGLPNRVLFVDRVAQAISAAKRYKRGFALMYLDLDEFKVINDTFGHAAGDLVLRSVAERILPILRESDTLARFGGDEFVVLQPLVNAAADSAELAEKIVAQLQAPFVVSGVERAVHTSIGVALYPQDGTSAHELMERADQALYRAKRAGRNGWCFFSDSTPHPR